MFDPPILLCEENITLIFRTNSLAVTLAADLIIKFYFDFFIPSSNLKLFCISFLMIRYVYGDAVFILLHVFAEHSFPPIVVFIAFFGYTPHGLLRFL
jgi:hypothetical protein